MLQIIRHCIIIVLYLHLIVQTLFYPKINNLREMKTFLINKFEQWWTYVGIRTLVSARTFKSDIFMASLVYDERANCKKWQRRRRSRRKRKESNQKGEFFFRDRGDRLVWE